MTTAPWSSSCPATWSSPRRNVAPGARVALGGVERTVSVLLERPILSWLKASLSWRYQDNNSNTDFSASASPSIAFNALPRITGISSVMVISRRETWQV